MDRSIPTAAWRDNSSCVIIIQEDENECILKIKPLNWKSLVKSLQIGLVFSLFHKENGTKELIAVN